jgi:hypothetical protein
MLLGTWLICDDRSGESFALLTEIHEILPPFFPTFFGPIWIRFDSDDVAKKTVQ